MKNVFFIAGPTATGKSELAAGVAAALKAEIVSADAFQIYRGMDLLTAKPDSAILARAPHHLLGSVALMEEMNAEKFRGFALAAIQEIHTRGKRAIVVGGSGLYLKALTHGLSPLPSASMAVRAELNALNDAELARRLKDLDPVMAETIDLKNRRRLIRALEVCLLTGKPVSAQRARWKSGETAGAAAFPTGVFVFRDRDELYERINRRVEAMFASGVVEEVREAASVGPTATKTIGFAEIHALLAGTLSAQECITQIQQATRRYAKRQLTWFRRQSNLESLNLSHLSHGQAVEWVTERTVRSFASMG
jgi:tRNA dimethylallyltransferase